MNQKRNRIWYWIITGLLIFELVYGALWDFNIMNKGYVYDLLSHLGYPKYLAGILGVSKILAAIVIVGPSMVLLKEWAYAGITILFAGAIASHLLSGDGVGKALAPIFFLITNIASYLLRKNSVNR